MAEARHQYNINHECCIVPWLKEINRFYSVSWRLLSFPCVKLAGPVSESGLYPDEVDGSHGLGEDE
jgi:hypothetical protein